MLAMSSPAQNARPSPDSTTQRTSFRPASRSIAAPMPVNIAGSIAFILSARANRTSAICSVTETVTRSSNVWISDNMASLLAPIAIPQQTLVEFAGRVARQLACEIDLARRLYAGKFRATPALQFLCKSRGRVRHIQRLDHRNDALAHLLVGRADHGDVGDPRVRYQPILDLLRIDIHAARDNHEALAVG